MPDYLFVCGVARSGTTALTRVLSAHERIVLGIERFKALNSPERITELIPARFTKEAFFDFRDGLTNILSDQPKWAPHYEAMQRKFAACAYIGDKVPDNHRFIPAIKRQFPGAKFVAILRDIFEVAPSWEARAKNAADSGWSAARDAKSAVRSWNQALEIFRRETTEGGRMVLIDHAAFFGGPDERDLDRVLGFLKLPRDAAISVAMAEARGAFRATVAPKPRVLPDDVRDYIGRTANLSLFEDLRAAAISDTGYA